MKSESEIRAAMDDIAWLYGHDQYRGNGIGANDALARFSALEWVLGVALEGGMDILLDVIRSQRTKLELTARN